MRHLLVWLPIAFPQELSLFVREWMERNGLPGLCRRKKPREDFQKRLLVRAGTQNDPDFGDRKVPSPMPKSTETSLGRLP